MTSTLRTPLNPADCTFHSRYHSYQAQLSTPQVRAQSDLVNQKLQTLSLSYHDSDILSKKGTTRRSDRDSTLIALCQFAATKLDAQVVGISLLGRYEQHVLADSTQKLESDDSTADNVFDDAFRQEVAQVQATLSPSNLRSRMS